MFQDTDLEWLKVIGCLKKAGMSIKNIRVYIELAMQGDETIDQRLELFRNQREVLRKQMAELQETMETLEYKCWFYETAQEAGTVEAPQSMTVEDIPEEHRKTYRRLKELVE